MADNALEEKINKIRQQNEEIRRRHEEVEEDKKNAAKLNALVQMVPSTDWPERKEPPEFSNPSRTNNKSKSAKEHHEHSQQYHSVSGEGKKVHTFAQGQGPPPDPKYNFLADAEREEGNMENTKDNLPNKGQKHSKANFKKKSGGKDGMQKDYRMNRSHRRDEHQPEYEAWRAERNRIDEDRISRQRTAEGNWRREWDNDKAHIANEMTRSEAKLGDYVKKDHKDFDRKHYVNGNDYASHNRSGYRSYRGNSRHFYNNYENRSNNAHHQEGHVKNPLSSNSEERTVVATDKSIKVTLNQGKGPVMSVKVNSLSIAGTGRVGPRQRSRVTYSSHADVEVVSADTESFSNPKSYDDKTKGNYHDNSRKSQPPKKKDFSNKPPYFRKKEIRREDANENSQKHHEIESLQKEHEESQKFNEFKLQKPEENIVMPLQNDEVVNEKENNVISSDEFDANTEVKSKDNQNDSLNSYIDEKSEAFANEGSVFILQDSDLPVSKDEIEICKISEEAENKLESQIVQTYTISENEIAKTDLTVSLMKDINDNDRDKTKSVGNLSCDANNDIDKTILENNEYNSSMEKIGEILSDNCDSKQNEDISEQENDFKLNIESSAEEKVETNNLIITSSIDVSSITEQNNKTNSDDKSLQEKEIVVVEDKVIAIDDKINTSSKQDVIKCTNETRKCKNENNENESNVVNSIAVDKVESQEEIHE
ncbi:myb-like protein X isoform X2 [Polyergus mexicanus]